VPTPDILAAQPLWAWFMVWAEYLTGNNTTAEIRATYGASRAMTRARIQRAVPAPLGPDLAAGRPVAAASSESTYLASRWAVDGDSRTRWSSAYSDTQWLYVDLGVDRRIGFVRLDWEAAYAAKYQIQVSTDEKTWITVFTDEIGNGGVDDIALTPVTARYVKLYAWVRATAYGYSLWQFEVYPPVA
jgi:mannan endo-1,4-beta-mannosidase